MYVDILPNHVIVCDFVFTLFEIFEKFVKRSAAPQVVLKSEYESGSLSKGQSVQNTLLNILICFSGRVKYNKRSHMLEDCKIQFYANY